MGALLKRRSFRPAEVQDITCPKQDEDTIIKSKVQKKEKHVFKMKRRTRMSQERTLYVQICWRKAKNTKIHMNQCK